MRNILETASLLASFALLGSPVIEKCDVFNGVATQHAASLILGPQRSSSVDSALKLEREGKPLDFILTPGVERSQVPHFRSPTEVRAAHSLLQEPYNRMLLVLRHPEAFGEDAPARQVAEARLILEEAFRKPPPFPGEGSDEKVIAALAVVARLGSESDRAILWRGSKWKEWYPKTFENVQKRIAKPTTDKELTEGFAKAFMSDIASQKPEIASHLAHSNKVGELLVKVREAQLKQSDKSLSKKEREDLYLAGLTHDIGKAFWPKELLAKSKRLNDQNFEWVKTKVKKGLETDANLKEVLEILDSLNRPINAKSPKPYALTPLQKGLLEQKGVFYKEGSPSILDREESQLLLADDIRLSEKERAKVNEHPGGYRILMALRPGGLEAKIAQVHHETLDGKGYPFGLKEGELGELERLALVVDIYEAATAPRPNSPQGKSHEEGIALLKGPHFRDKVDQSIVDLLDATVKASR